MSFFDNFISSVKEVFRKENKAEGRVITVLEVEKWKELLKSANECKQLVVIYFTAAWCPPCRLMSPMFEEIANEMTDVIFLKVDVDEMKSIAKDYEVTEMPTFVFYKDGNKVDKLVGMKQKNELLATVIKHA